MSAPGDCQVRIPAPGACRSDATTASAELLPDAVRRRRAAERAALGWMVVGVLLIGALVPWLANAYWIKTLTSSMALAIAAAGVALLYGQLGLVSLCQYALLGVGGWVALRIAHGLQWPFELCVIAAGVSASALGMVAGLPALRLKGLVLALVTLMLAGGFQVVISATGFPDGGPGWLGRISGSERLLMPRPALARGDGAYFTYVAAWLAAMTALIELHRRTRAGRSWALIRRGEAVAVGAGVNVLLYQTWAFGLAGGCAGVAGALLAGAVGQLDGRAFAASESVLLFALTIVGGSYHWVGSIVAGLLLRAVPSLLVDLGVNGFLAMVFFGAALLHALITAPHGVAGQLVGVWSGWRGRRRRRNGGEASR
jgi:branched-chain amino acid transport system permease protein